MDKYLKLKEILTEKVEDNLSDLIALNDDLADHPELSGEEHRSSKKIAEILEKKGFRVEMPFAGLALAKVPWSKWAKWILPLIGLQFIEANIGIRDGKIVYLGNETPEAASMYVKKNVSH